MQFDCIWVLPVVSLALIAAFGRCDPRANEFKNPDYCWAFAYYMKNKTEYADWLGRKCCDTANTTDDIPKDNALKKIVNIHF